MAARNRSIHLDDRWKDKIKASMLINRLRNFALSRFSPTSEHYMAPHQVQACAALLRKVIPDLAAVEHKGEVAIRPVIEPEPTPVEWKEAFAEPVQIPKAAVEVRARHLVDDGFDRSLTEEDILKKLDEVP